jgi:hypothetical protein
MFKGCTNLKQVSLTTSIKLLTIDNMFSESGIEVAPYFITSKATSVTNMFYKCKSLKEVPAYQFNSATVLTNVFNYCTKLETVPVLGVANAVSMQNMFQYCNKLTDESLNNIMQMCINATKVTNASYKKLSYLGLTTTQATRCKSLSNYQAFLDAGWVTGY